jgi:hypothetical protein
LRGRGRGRGWGWGWGRENIISHSLHLCEAKKIRGKPCFGFQDMDGIKRKKNSLWFALYVFRVSQISSKQNNKTQSSSN